MIEVNAFWLGVFVGAFGFLIACIGIAITIAMFSGNKGDKQK